MKLLSGISGFILIALAIAFAVFNRQPVAVSLWPFDARIEAPLFLLTLGVFLLGLVLGAGFAWLNMLPHQWAARRMRKDIAHLHDRLEELQQTIVATPRQSGETSALLPAKPKWRFWRKR